MKDIINIITHKELIVLGPVKSGTDVSLLLANQLQDPRKRKKHLL